ncbi:hypothetical protein FACS189499_07730 [Clostridia bacterium]|nr:hypothetical protein FACS189499_07730 [Clostridia bacterium]
MRNIKMILLVMLLILDVLLTGEAIRELVIEQISIDGFLIYILFVMLPITVIIHTISKDLV